VIIDGIKTYFTLHNSNIAWESIKDSLKARWYASAFNFLSQNFKIKFRNLNELNNVVHTYFMTVNVFYCSVFYILRIFLYV